LKSKTMENKIISEDLLLRSFFRLFQIVKIYRSDNQLLIENVAKFVDAITKACIDEDRVDLQIYRGRFYLRGEKLIHRPDMLNVTKEMIAYLQKRGAYGLRFYKAIREETTDSVVNFFEMLDAAERMENPPVWLQKSLQSKGCAWAEILTETDSKIIVHDPGLLAIAKTTYSHALTSMKTMAEKLTTHKRVGVHKAKRVIQDMIEILTEDDSILLCMSTIRDYDDYTYTHSVNVALLSMCLGKRLGLSRLTLERLGLCGLFHDLGKVDIPHDLINKPGELTTNEYDQIKKHSVNSVRHIIKINADHILKAKLLLPPFEHHLGLDLSGYPQTDRTDPVSLLGRILTITDNYDALTSARSYRSEPLSPALALQIMMERSGTYFDPLILKVFINTIGIYPVGTLLLLDKGQMCIVLETPETSDARRPLGILIHYVTGGEFRKGERVDLSMLNPETGDYLRNIVKTLHPAYYGIQPIDFLA
jgi:HD-GYP domain-containing protein (c-di-GMP phosphodiesterase class II)